MIPFQLFISLGNLNLFLRASKLPKLSRLTKIMKLIRTARTRKRPGDGASLSLFERIHRLIKLNAGVDQIIVNIFMVFIFCHIFACLWHFFARISEGEDNWIWAKGMEDASILNRYLTSLYWITQTVITVGYGDIPISNSTERIVAILAMFAGVIFFSVTVGSLTSIIRKLDKRGMEFETKLNTLLEIKKSYKISNSTFNKIRKIIKFGIYKSEETFVEFLSFLPEVLRVEVGFRIYRKLVHGISFFENTEKKFISDVGPCLKKLTYNKGEIIFSEGENSHEMFFIKSGGVGYVIPEFDNVPFMLIGKGNYFGEVDMIYGQKRKFSVVAQSHDVELLVLDLNHYRDEISLKYPQLNHSLRESSIARRFKQIRLYEEVANECLTMIDIYKRTANNKTWSWRSFDKKSLRLTSDQRLASLNSISPFLSELPSPV